MRKIINEVETILLHEGSLKLYVGGENENEQYKTVTVPDWVEQLVVQLSKTKNVKQLLSALKNNKYIDKLKEFIRVPDGHEDDFKSIMARIIVYLQDGLENKSTSLKLGKKIKIGPLDIGTRTKIVIKKDKPDEWFVKLSPEVLVNFIVGRAMIDFGWIPEVLK